ncbi:MAG: GNAT family N-acetyltransferase [Frankiaceae bacterium]
MTDTPGQPAVNGVREARAGDVAAVAAVQVRTWRAAYAGLLPATALDALDALDPAEVAAAWGAALAARPAGRAHLLVAVAADRVVGLAAGAPAPDDDLDPSRWAELGPLLVLPERQREGHGSRLLAAVTDLLLADGFRYAVTWVPAADERSLAFLVAAGWAPDGASRALDLAGTAVEEIRLHTDLAG